MGTDKVFQQAKWNFCEDKQMFPMGISVCKFNVTLLFKYPAEGGKSALGLHCVG
jgi:hypothetical protein